MNHTLFLSFSLCQSQSLGKEGKVLWCEFLPLAAEQDLFYASFRGTERVC